MRLFLDLDTRSFIESVQFQRGISSLVLKRRDHLPVDVQFLSSGVVAELADGAAGKLGLKADKDFNGSFAASDLEWTKSGTGEATTYRFDLNLNTVQINALFAGVPTPSSVALMLEIEWAEGDLRTSSNTLAVTLENDIVRGDEGIVEDGTPEYPLPGEMELISRKGQPAGYAALDQDGKVPASQLPGVSLNSRVTVANDAARFALTTDSVQDGDYVFQTDTSVLYEVTDAANLANTNGYSALATVTWGSISGKPDTFTPPTASTTVLGGFKVGANLSIDESGVLAATGGGGGGSETYVIKSSAFTAEVGAAYALDTIGGSFDVIFPESPTEGQTVCFCDARGTWNSHPPTFLRNGHKIEAHEVDFTDSAQGTFFCAVFIDSTTGWRILESGTKPQNLTAPTISGNTVGAVVTSTTGSWTGSPTSFTYQWQISDDGSTDWENIIGATSSTYLSVSGDAGKFVRVTVTASNANGTSLPATSEASDALEVPSFPTGAIAHWRLNETSGVRVDATGNGNDLTDNNDVLFATGKLGNAADFDGTNWLSMDLSGEVVLSFAGWCRFDESASTYNVILSGIASFNIQVAEVEGGFVWAADIGGPKILGASPTGGWDHVALVMRETEATLYVNNVPYSLERSGTPEGSSCLTLGSDGSNHVNGGVDSASIWSRELSAAEVTTLYNGGDGMDYPS